MKYERSLVLSCILVMISSMIIPAYADIPSFKTDKTFYGKTSKITFSGVVEEDDYGELVTIVIEDPSGEFVHLIQATSDIDNKFEKTIDVSKFYTLAGIYNATAFITNKTNGIVIDFDIEKQRPVITPTPPESEPKQDENTQLPDTQASQTSGSSQDTKTIQDKIKERIEAAKKLKESQTLPNKINENVIDQPTNDGTAVTNNTMPVDNSNKEEKKSDDTIKPGASIDSTLLYVIIGLGGAGAAGAIMYSMKNKSRPKDYSSYFAPVEKTESAQKSDMQSEDDYALMILKNRLAKGEITIDEFNELKKALKEP